MLGSQDVKQAYRRSAFGPFWITIGMGVQIGTMGIVFSQIFKADLQNYLPFLAVSIVIWGLISSTVNDGCSTFVASEALLKQLRLPLSLYVFRVVWKNLITSAHNFVLLPLLFLTLQIFPTWTVVALIPGLLILILNLFWLVWILGMISARFRDIPPIVSSLVTIAFYVTPVMWFPKLIDDDTAAHVLLGLNPLYHWVQVVRLPILGQWPTMENWGVSSLSAAIGWILASVAYSKYKTMIAYWV